MWSYDANVSFMARSNLSDATLEKMRAAATREQLNGMYIKNGTLMVLDGGQVKLAHKVSQVGGKQAPFRVHFAAAPGKKQVQDTVVEVADLQIATSTGTLGGVEHLLFGYKDGAFRGTDGGYLHVVDAVPALAGADAFTGMSVVQWGIGESRPALSTASELGLSEFLTKFLGASLDPRPERDVTVIINLREMPKLRSVMHASKLLQGENFEEAELSTMELFVSAVFETEVSGKVKVTSATAQLEGLLAGKTALRGGAGWAEGKAMGIVSGFGAAQAGRYLRSAWFIQQPKLGAPTKKRAAAEDMEALDVSGDDDDSESEDSGDELPDEQGVDSDDGDATPKRTSKKRMVPPQISAGKHAKVLKCANLLALVPRCGSMTKMQTARVIFEEARVRTLADCEDIPSDAAMAGREFRYESRCDEALERLFNVIGKRMLPIKPPKDGRALERTAEDIYSAVGAAMRGAPSGAAQRSGQAATSFDVDDSERKPEKAQGLKESRSALSSDVAERLYADRAAIDKAWTDSSRDPSTAMRLVTDPGLRDDLARAMSSNGNVYAPGEQAVAKRNVPPSVHKMRESMLARVAVSLRACAGSDMSCEMHMSDDAALPLAESALAGNFKWATFATASKAMRKSAAAKTGSVLEIAQTFELLEAAWAAVLEMVYCVPNDAGIRELRQLLGSTAQTQSAKLADEQQVRHSKGLVVWMERVMEHFGEATRAFRKGGDVRPTIQASKAAFEQMYTNLASLSAMAPQMAEWFPKQKQQQQQQQRPPKGSPGRAVEVEPGAGTSAGAKRRRAKKEKGKQNGKAPKGALALTGKAAESGTDSEGETDAPAGKGEPGHWEDRPKMDADQWAKVMASFRKTYPDACSWHHLGRCKFTDTCKKSHKKAIGFDNWKLTNEE